MPTPPQTVLRTRVMPPRPQPFWIRRDRLAGAVIDGLSGRLVTVVACAGFGKTTLLAQVRQEVALPWAWLSCDARMADPARLLAHLAAALGDAVPDMPAVALTGGPDHQIALLSNAASRLGADLVLSIDDAHHVLASRQGTDALVHLIHDLPPNVRLVVGSRTALPFSLARLRVHGLTELTAADLALDTEECRTLAAAVTGAPQGHRTCAEVLHRSDGWVACALLVLRFGPAAARGAVRDYVAETVLAGIDAPTLERLRDLPGTPVTGTAGRDASLEAWSHLLRVAPDGARRLWRPILETLAPPAAVSADPPASARPRPAAAGPVRLITLGGLAVNRDGHPIPPRAFGRRKALALLAALACAGGPVHRERITNWFWPDLPERRGIAALHSTIYCIRRAIGESSGALEIARDGETYRLVLDDGASWDAGMFLRCAAEACAAGTGADAVDRLIDAERRHDGRDFLPDWPFADWAAERRTEVTEAYGRVVSLLAVALANAGRGEEASLRMRRLIAREPGREEWHRVSMQVYALRGERALAVRQYHECRRILRDELGVEPGPAIRGLHAELVGRTLPPRERLVSAG